MLCDQCQERQATVHMTKIVNGQKTERHLCEVCARQGGAFESVFNTTFSIPGLLSSLVAQNSGQLARAAQREQEQRCPACGLTWAQFGKTGNLGCSHCYDHFSEQLGPLIRRVHGATVHTGKVPSRAGGRVKLKKQLSLAQQALGQAIAQEAFEKAAELRDQIRMLERKLAEEGR